MLGRECNTTSVAQAFDIWAVFPRSTKSIQSLQDLFFHCRWSCAHVSLPLALGSTLLLAQHTPFCIKGRFHPICSTPSAHTRHRERQRCMCRRHTDTGKHAWACLYIWTLSVILYYCFCLFYYYLQIKALKESYGIKCCMHCKNLCLYFCLVFQYKYLSILKSLFIYLRSYYEDMKSCFVREQNPAGFCLKHKQIPVNGEWKLIFPLN